VYSSLLFTVTLYCFAFAFKLTQPLTVSRVQVLYTVEEKGGKPPDRNPYPFLYGLRNPYRYLKFENSQDYIQKSQRNCTVHDLCFRNIMELACQGAGKKTSDRG
jgi:hypothetical protein